MATARSSPGADAVLRLAMAWAVLAVPAAGRTIEAGPPEAHGFAQAVAQAQDGDTIHLGVGAYFECAFVRVKDLTIQGDGDASVLTDATCAGKAILVAQADNLTLRDLVLARARVSDMNGAGVRLEAQGLVLERVRFLNDQVGLLAGAGGPGTVRVSECRFEGGGVAGDRPGAALLVGGIGRLMVEQSSFAGVRGGQISTAAGRTELVGNQIETGVEPGAGFAVIATGGTLVMRDNVIAVGPNPAPRDAAVLAESIGAELRGNTLRNTTGRPVTLLLDWMHASPVLQANSIGAGDSESGSGGVWRHRAGVSAREMVVSVRGIAGRAKRALAGLLGR